MPCPPARFAKPGLHTSRNPVSPLRETRSPSGGLFPCPGKTLVSRSRQGLQKRSASRNPVSVRGPFPLPGEDPGFAKSREAPEEVHFAKPASTAPPSTCTSGVWFREVGKGSRRGPLRETRSSSGGLFPCPGKTPVSRSRQRFRSGFTSRNRPPPTRRVLGVRITSTSGVWFREVSSSVPSPAQGGQSVSRAWLLPSRADYSGEVWSCGSEATGTRDRSGCPGRPRTPGRGALPAPGARSGTGAATPRRGV